MLSATPIGVDDAYQLPNDGGLVVGEVGGRIARYEAPLPDPADLTPDGNIVVTGGQVQHDPGFLTIGGPAGSFGQIEVAGAGSQVIVHQYLAAGFYGFARVAVTDGGLLHTTNWTELGHDVGGVGVGLVSGPGSRWLNDNFLRITDQSGRSRLLVEDGATMLNGNHLTIGGGLLHISGGASVVNQNWTEVGQETSRRGELLVTGPGSLYRTNEWMEIGGGPGEGVVTVMDGAAVEIGNWLEVLSRGRLQGDGRIRIGGWFENEGVIEPGAPVGVMTLEGNVMQQPSGRIAFDVRGTQRGTEYDGLDISFALHAGGTLEVRFLDGFAPKAGDRFELIRAGVVDGSFPSVAIRGLAPGFAYTVTTEGGTVVLTASNDGVALPTPDQQGVLTNDSDADGDKLSTILVDAPDKGTLQLYENGAFRYVPGPQFDGSDEFTYQVTDQFRRSTDVTVTIKNERPVAAADSYTVVEDGVLESLVSVLANDSDAEGAALTAQLVAGPGQGTLELRPDGTFVYTPKANFAGVDSFSYRAHDGVSGSEPVRVELVVQATPDAPVAVDDRFTVPKGGSILVTAGDLLENDFDPDGDVLSIVGVRATPESHGTVSSTDDYALVFDSEPGYVGPAVVEYIITDGITQTVGRVLLLIDPTQDPTPQDDVASVRQGERLTIPVGRLLANDSDPDGDNLYVHAVTALRDTHGSVKLEDDVVTYVPDQGFAGAARFEYHVQDLRGGYGTAVVTVNVLPRTLAGRVEGLGSLDGAERIFAFQARNLLGPAGAGGYLSFIDLERRLSFQATSIGRLEIGAGGRAATFSGVGRLNGRAGYEFVVTIEDAAGRRGRDTFRIQITGRRDFRYDSLDHAEREGRIDGGGNVRITAIQRAALADFWLARQAAFGQLEGAPSPVSSAPLRVRARGR